MTTQGRSDGQETIRQSDNRTIGEEKESDGPILQRSDCPTLRSSFPCRPALLVSARNAAEARSAMAGRCDILDVKEPSRGPMGMADVGLISEIAFVAGLREASFSGRPQAGARGDAPPRNGKPAPPPLSVALGEVADWLDGRSVPRLPIGVGYAKLAFAGCGRTRDWTSRWLEVRTRFEQNSVDALNGQAGSPIRWVAVAYADWQQARAPSPEQIVESAAQTGCVAVLIDTFTKEGRTLLDWLPLPRLRRIADQSRRTDMMLGLAGSLQAALLPALAELQPDVIGIRTAACRRGCRSARISAEAVRAFKDSISTAFGFPLHRCGASHSPL